jgi:NDP-sugar pyrophosphorylase family protein
MGCVTDRLPKPLLYLPGGTLLEHQLALLARLPISHTFVVIRHRSERMEQALQGYEGVTSMVQSPPSTLLGALASAQGHVTEPFVVLHADNYFSQGMEHLLQEAQAAPSGCESDAAFLVDPQASRHDRALRLASTGCYLLSPEVFPIVKQLQDSDELLCLTSALLEHGALVQEVPLRGWRANINRLKDLLQVSDRILEDWSGCFHPPGAGEGHNRVEGCLKAEFPLWVSAESEVVDSYLGPDVVVGPHARVRNCALRDVIVFPGAEIVGQKLEGDVVLPSS